MPAVISLPAFASDIIFRIAKRPGCSVFKLQIEFETESPLKAMPGAKVSRGVRKESGEGTLRRTFICPFCLDDPWSFLSTFSTGTGRTRKLFAEGYIDSHRRQKMEVQKRDYRVSLSRLRNFIETPQLRREYKWSRLMRKETPNAVD